MSLTDQAEMQHLSSSSYKEGMDAYYNGVLYEQNPYRGTTNFAALNQWADGWCNAEQADCLEYDYEG